MLYGILIGGRTSLFVGAIVGIVTTVIGTVIGGLAGYQKSLDAPLMRLVDLLLVIPRLPLLIFLSLLLKPSVWNVIVLLSVFVWPMTARSVRLFHTNDWQPCYKSLPAVKHQDDHPGSETTPLFSAQSGPKERVTSREQGIIHLQHKAHNSEAGCGCAEKPGKTERFNLSLMRPA